MPYILARNWWALALRGLTAVLFGVMAFVWPEISLLALVLWFSVYALIDGILAVIAAVRAAGRQQRWGAMLIEGLVGIATGMLAMFWPGLTALALLYLIAAWSILTGVLEIVAAITLRHAIKGEWLLALGGVASVLFGLLLIVFPGAGALTVLWLIGSFALLFGIVLLVLALRLRRWYTGHIHDITAQRAA